MNKYLIVRLQGVMQAWGGHTFEDYRPSNVFPTRSGIVGLLAACLGLDRKDYPAQQNLSDSFIYAVRVDDNSFTVQKITDYHTVMEARKVDGKVNPNAVISHREYLCDAHFTLALEFLKNSAISLESLKIAIMKPYYTPTLGRRSCPLSVPLFEEVIEAENILLALDNIAPYRGIVYSEFQEKSVNRLVIRDVPLFGRRRQFATRAVYIHAHGGYHVSK